MQRFVMITALVAATSTASWFSALSYADWKRHTEQIRWEVEWLRRCSLMKDIILMRISDPGSELKTGQLVGTEDQNWERCRKVGVITAHDEQTAYVERQRRQEERFRGTDLKLPPPR